MPDKLSIVNDALIETGNNPVDVAFDGSPEWIAGSAAYERALKVVLAEHSWNFGTITEELSRAESNPSQRFADGYAYRIPANALFVQTVYASGAPYTNYEIVDRCICTDAEAIAVLYVRQPAESQWPPLFVEALTKRVEAGVLRALNEDFGEAERREAQAMMLLNSAKNQADRQAPAHTVLKSRMLRRRRGSVTGAFR